MEGARDGAHICADAGVPVHAYALAQAEGIGQGQPKRDDPGAAATDLLMP